ncbi:hypothetical protein BD779DRAFT_1500321 [Infundibulicybe gibba]|nr:hypothetical protein BD779DRAFT_1500321 [Infundibulicybe gibba]
MPQTHTEYAPPVLRAPSPASSVGTAYGPDQTSFSDSEHQLNLSDLELKYNERMGLGKPRDEEVHANQDPLLPRPSPDSPEGRDQYEQVMRSLRLQVQQLEDDELFEQTLLRGSQASLEPQPSSNDIDVLMRSMMTAPPGPLPLAHRLGVKNHTTENVSDGPWNKRPNGVDMDSGQTSGATLGKKGKNGRGRSRKV